jgi:hypothetical protein
VTSVPVASQTVFSDAKSESFDDLPGAFDDEDYPTLSDDASAVDTASAASDSRPPDEAKPGYCAGCGDPIIREPGARGRLPKYHPDCRPKPGATRLSAGPSANSKAEKEAEQAVAAFKSLAVKATLLLSAVDKYDAFAVMASLPQICENLKAVLVQYPRLRKEFLSIGSGGSILGLVISVLMLALSISAHHGLIPARFHAEVLVKAPMVLHNIQSKLAEGEASLTQMMREQFMAEQAAKAKANGGQ